jgi:threonine/homoserine/homoserine lactone efflux protein
MIAALLLGLSYGFTAGVSPGPLLGLVITQTLRRGWRAGNLVALAPLLTDIPIIALAVLLIAQLPRAALGWIGILGGLFVMFLGVESLRATRGLAAPEGDDADPTRHSLAGAGQYGVLWGAMVTNALNPHPYLFWASAGAPLLIQISADAGFAGVAAFLAGFYALMVGSKLLVALIVSRSRGWLRGSGYRRVLAASGALLLGLGLLLLGNGVLALLGDA